MIVLMLRLRLLLFLRLRGSCLRGQIEGAFLLVLCMSLWEASGIALVIRLLLVSTLS